MVDTQLCKLRDATGELVLYPVPHLECVPVLLILTVDTRAQFHNFRFKPFPRILPSVFVKDSSESSIFSPLVHFQESMHLIPGININSTGTVLRGTIVNRTYDTHKKLYISLFLLTIFGPIYYGPPYLYAIITWMHVRFPFYEVSVAYTWYTVWYLV